MGCEDPGAEISGTLVTNVDEAVMHLVLLPTLIVNVLNTSSSTTLMPNTAVNWRQVAGAKKASLLSLIPPAWRLDESEIPPTSRLKDVTTFVARFLSPLEQQITTATVPSILENIFAFNWSAVEVTRAFCHRAALAHQLVNRSLNCSLTLRLLVADKLLV